MVKSFPKLFGIAGPQRWRRLSDGQAANPNRAHIGLPVRRTEHPGVLRNFFEAAPSQHITFTSPGLSPLIGVSPAWFPLFTVFSA
jgi:hypothetical protein